MTTAEAVRPQQNARSVIERLTSPAGLLLSAVMAVALIPVTSTITDPDFWWHLRAGQLIIARGGLVPTDPFTYTVASHTWTMHEWLSEVVMAALQRAAGMGAIVLVFSAVTWLGLVCVMQRARWRAPAHIVAFTMVLAVLAGYPIWGPRVQMITFCCSALTLLLVERHLVRGGRAIWLLVPLFLLWSNLHSGFIIGLGFIALVFVAEHAGRWLRMPSPAPAARARTLLPVLITCGAVAMINPNGPGILLYAFETQASSAQQALIQEWHSPDFHQAVLIPFGVMLISLGALVAVNRRLRARDAALLLATTALALQSVRHVALFVAATAPIWAEQVHLLLQRRRTRPRRVARALPPLPFRLATSALLLTVLLVAYAGLRLVPAMTTRPDAPAYAQEFPVCAARWLAQAPEPLRIFNQYGEGGYLADQLSARGDRVFIFGDAALMGDQLLDSYAQVESVQPDWESIIRGAGSDVVLFDARTPLANVLASSSRWVLVYHDPVSVVYAPAETVASLHLPPQPSPSTEAAPCNRLTAPAGSGT